MVFGTLFFNFFGAVVVVIIVFVVVIVIVVGVASPLPTAAEIASSFFFVRRGHFGQRPC